MPKYNPSAYTRAYRAGMTNTNPKGTISTKKQMERRAKNKKSRTEFSKKVKKAKSSIAKSYQNLGVNLPEREYDKFMALHKRTEKARQAERKTKSKSTKSLVRIKPGQSRGKAQGTKSSVEPYPRKQDN